MLASRSAAYQKGMDLSLGEPNALSVGSALVPLFPGGLQRGVVMGISGTSSTSLLLAVLAEPMRQGSWAAIAGLPAIGVEAAEGLGTRLDHLVIVPRLGAHWPEVVAGLIDACAITAVVAPTRCSPGFARRLSARARERRSLLIVMELNGGHSRSIWPEAFDLQLSAKSRSWTGLGAGYGALGSRQVEVVAFGRRGAGRERRARIMLPTVSGGLAGDRPTAIGGIDHLDLSTG